MPKLIFTPPLIAHRGASALAPENTLAAIKLAREHGAAWVEFDVKLTQDGVPILMHDDTLDRTTNGKGKVAEMDWAEIQTLIAGSWFDKKFADTRVPQLSEVLHLVLDCGLNINLEIKPCPGRAKATTMVALMEVAKVWPRNHTLPLISSFDEEALAAAAQFHPAWPRSFAFEDWRDDWQSAANAVGAAALTVDEKLMTKDRTPALVRSGMAVLVYTLNDAVLTKQMLDQGVAAVFCDDPKALIAALK